MVIPVNDSSFETEVLNSSQPVLVDFWAEWCGPCRMVAPIVEEISRKYDGKLKVAKVNVDENPETAAKFGITAIPTLIIFKNGQPVVRIVGYQSQTALEAKINEVL